MVLKRIKIFHSNGFQTVKKMGFWFKNKPSGNPGGDSRVKKYRPEEKKLLLGGMEKEVSLTSRQKKEEENVHISTI
jgi:hypothetical protein